MRSGAWDGATSTDNVRVTVNGAVRPVERVRITSGMRDGHPAAPFGVWCVESTITWANPQDVAAGAPEPFSGTSWLPNAGDSVVIETGDGALGQWWVQHTGVIDDTTGSLADGTAVSTTVDQIDNLSGRVTYPALLSAMTPLGSATLKREMGLQSTFLIDRLMRYASGDAFGWHATPPRTWETFGSAPNQGSLWPEVGTLLNTGSATSGPSWRDVSYGTAPTNFEAEYSLISPASDVVLSTAIFGAGTGSAYVRALDDSGIGVRVGYDAGTDNVVVGTVGAAPASTWSLPRLGVTRAAVYFKRLSTTEQQVTLRLSDGREQTWIAGATTYPAGWAATRVLCESTSGTTLGWWICEGPKPAVNRWATVNHVPSARIRPSSGNQWWNATRDLISINPAEWLSGQVDAELATMWLDEDGVMQWSGRGVLETQPVAQTVTTKLDIDDIQWASRRRSLAKSVVITNLVPRIDMDPWGRVSRNLWRDDGVDVGRGESETLPISVPEDEDWVGVDLAPHHVNGWNHSFDYYNIGSVFGGTQYDGDDDSAQAWAAFVDCTMVRENLRDYTITYGTWPTIPESHRVKSAFPGATNMRSATAALVLRSRARTVWAERESSAGAGTTGPAQYTHDVGWRVQPIGTVGQPGDALANLRADLAAAVTSTKPTMDDVVLAHDPRRQIGDKLRLQDLDVSGLEFEMLLQQRTFDSDTFTDKISGRTIASGQVSGLHLEHPSDATALTPSTDWTRST